MTKVKSSNRALSAVLVLMIVISLFAGLGVTASAASSWDGTIPAANSSYGFSGGNGSQGTPFIVNTAADLAQLAANVNAGTVGEVVYDSTYFQLTNDIDLGGFVWAPIGGNCAENSSTYIPVGPSFGGYFDGQNHTISGLYISDSSSQTTPVPPVLSGASAFGLFGYATGGGIANLTVNGTSGAAGGIDFRSDKEYVGGIVGYTNGNVYNCHTNINITFPTDGQGSNVGGVVGAIESIAASGQWIIIQYSSATGSIYAGKRIGGVVGGVYCKYAGGARVDDCSYTPASSGANPTITVSGSSKGWAGGIVGYCRGWVSNSYSINFNMTSPNGGHYMGGLAGLLQGNAPMASLYYSYTQPTFLIGNTSYDRPMVSSMDDSNVLPILNDFYVSPGTGYTQPVGDGTNGWGTWSYSAGAYNPITTTQLDEGDVLKWLSGNYTQTTSFSENYPILNWQTDIYGGGTFYVAPESAAPNTPGGGTAYIDDDDPTQIFLDPTAKPGGDGSHDNPFTTLADALNLLSSTRNTIYIKGDSIALTATTALTSSVSGATIKRSSVFDGYLFTVSAGTTTVSNITIDGNLKEFLNITPTNSLFLVNTGGTLNISTGALLTNNYASNGGAIRIMGGVVNMTAGQISGNHAYTNAGAVGVYSSGTFNMSGGTLESNSAENNAGAVGLYNGGSFVLSGGSISLNDATLGDGIYVSESNTLTLSPSGANAITLTDDIYLSSGVTFNIGADLGVGVSGTISVNFADPSVGRVVATASDPTYASSSANKLTTASPYTFFGNPSTGVITLTEPELA